MGENACISCMASRLQPQHTCTFCLASPGPWPIIPETGRALHGTRTRARWVFSHFHRGGGRQIIVQNNIDFSIHLIKIIIDFAIEI